MDTREEISTFVAFVLQRLKKLDKNVNEISNWRKLSMEN